MAVRRRQLLGWYQVLSGVAGIVLVVWAAAHPEANLPGGAWYAIGPFALLALAGVHLLQGRRDGVPLSIALQLGQVLFFSINGVVWKFVAGIQASIWITMERSYAKAGVETTLLAGWGASAEPFLFGVNIAPLIAIGVLSTLIHDRPHPTMERQGETG
jgi:hypothetical protein